MGLEALFGKPRVLVGMVHLGALPGSPGYQGAMEDLVRRAVEDALALESGGLDGAVVENFFDTPFYPDAAPPETVAAMAVILAEVRRAVRFPVGANVLRNDAAAALGLAAACGAEFIRVNVHTGASVTDQGLVQGRAHETLRLRERLWAGVDDAAPLIFADVDVKHASPLSPYDLGQMAEDTFRRGRADVLLVTGSGTGREASFDDLRRVREAVPEAPVLVASGVTDRTVARAIREAHGALVGSWLKRDGQVASPVDRERVRALVEAAKG
jgi:uncharacterized protein